MGSMDAGRQGHSGDRTCGRNAGDSAGVDITGGMFGKLTQIKEILEFGFDVKLVNIMQVDRLRKLLSGQEIVHSHFSANSKS